MAFIRLDEHPPDDRNGGDDDYGQPDYESPSAWGSSSAGEFGGLITTSLPAN